MVPSAATASVPQLLHFPLDVDIWREGAGFNKRVWFGRGSVEVRGVCQVFNLNVTLLYKNY